MRLPTVHCVALVALTPLLFVVGAGGQAAPAKRSAAVVGQLDTSYLLTDLPQITGQALPPNLPPDRPGNRTVPRILAMSDDGATLVWSFSLPRAADPSKRDAWLIVNGKRAGPMVEEISAASVRLSRDGRHVAWAAQMTPPGAAEPRWFVVHDGARGGPYRAVDPLSLTFSPDGTQLAFVAHADHGGGRVVVNGQPGETTTAALPDFASIAPVIFSPDSRRVAVAATTSFGDGDLRWGVWVDGKPLAGDDKPVTPLACHFSPDSKRLAVRLHVRNQPTPGDYGFAVMRDGVIGPVYADVAEGSLHFSADSARFVYVAGDIAQNYFLVENGKAGAAYNFIYPDTIRFGGKRIAFIAGTGPRAGAFGGSSSREPGRHFFVGQPTLIVDGQPTAGLARPPLALSADGARIAYFGEAPRPPPATHSSPCVIVDGKPDPWLQQIMHLQFSPNGKHYAYVGGENPGGLRDSLVVDGVLYKQFAHEFVHRMTIDDQGAVTALVDDLKGVYRRIVYR
jgi:hypothetical protein